MTIAEKRNMLDPFLEYIDKQGPLQIRVTVRVDALRLLAQAYKETYQEWESAR